MLCGITNVILHNIQVSALGESDTVHIFAGSTKIWVDHVTSFEAKLGLVSVLQGSTDVTISNSHLSNFNFNMLLGASDNDKEDEDMRVTVYRNWFKDSMQRMPHCRSISTHSVIFRNRCQRCITLLDVFMVFCGPWLRFQNVS